MTTIEKIQWGFKLLRPHQWIKNGIVFFPLIFGGFLFDGEKFAATLLAAIGFCFVSSSVYCLNDVIDYDNDVNDPEKCRRPVASGVISKGEALLLSIVMAGVGLLLGWGLVSCEVFFGLLIYWIINILYCLWLKQQMLIDVMTVALGFVLRVVVGGLAASVELSRWIIIMIFLLALFLSVAKRRHEVVEVENERRSMVRKSAEGYNKPFLDATLSILGAVLIIGYILYTLQPRPTVTPLSDYLYVTSLPVLYGILRYLRLTIVDNRSGSPTYVVYSDKGIKATVVVWLVSFVLIIYC
ncbi:MAG: UbiA prenyltransferase family protein [Muribaculaceae bacterium]|nr:UbiA prenyltransferase family protein [Muribaculaceae bacterium]